MSQPRIGEPAPEFELPATGDRTLRLSDLRGHNVVIHSNPRATTSPFDTGRILRREWRGVKFPGHVDAVRQP